MTALDPVEIRLACLELAVRLFDNVDLGTLSYSPAIAREVHSMTVARAYERWVTTGEEEAR